ncbi:antibiotic biosynthesis monooxygenase [Streptomyces sp. NPDC000963]|uniref:antibiotic biosynthesis monooxygenase n=1 Tax=Streptomyces sp. NPDC088752 TaxID=3154963 RepID=UPI003431B172
MHAVAHPHARPDLYRPGVGAVLVSTWRVGTPERQRAAVEAVRKAWEGREWPDPGLLSYSIYAGTDGDALLHYSQWTGEEVYEDFVRTHRDDRNAEIDAAVPGIERVVLHRYAPPRPAGAPGPDALPGAVSVVSVVESGDGDAVAAGGIGTHVHRSADGTRVLVLTEWEDVPPAGPAGARWYTPALSLGAGVR